MLQRIYVIKHVLLYHQIVCVTGYRFNSIYNNMYMFLQPLHVIFVQLLINPYHNAIIVSRLFYTYKLQRTARKKYQCCEFGEQIILHSH